MAKVSVLTAYLLCLGLTFAQGGVSYQEPSMLEVTTAVPIYPTSWKDEQHCGNDCYQEFYWTSEISWAVRNWDTTEHLDSVSVTPRYLNMTARVPASGDISFFRPHLAGQTTTTTATTATIMSTYGLWQEVWSEGVCTDVSSAIILKSIPALSKLNLGPDDFASIPDSASAPGPLSSMIISQLGRPLCTRSTYTQTSSSYSLPKVQIPLQTSVDNIDNLSTGAELTQAAKVGVGILIGTGSGLIFSFLIFFIRKRRLGNRILKRKAASEDKVQAKAKSQPEKIHRKSFWHFPLARYQSIGRQNMAHWNAPLAMLGGLLAGVTLAISHHYMYANITGQPVHSLQISQSWVFRFGTLLAFLIKVSFAISVGTAFSQLQWLEIHRKPFSVGEIDTVSNAMGDILNFTNKVWLLFPKLTLLAVIWWLLSLVPVMAPGSLIVVSEAHQQASLLIAPQLNTSSAWGAGLNYDVAGHTATGDPIYQLTDILPLPAFSRLLFSTALGGQLLFSAPQNANQSFHLNFLAPAVDCHPANASTTTIAALSSLVNPLYFYLAWVGSDYWMREGGTYPSKVDLTSYDAARLYIAFSNDYTDPPVAIDGGNYIYENVTECLLYNASYSASFTYRNSELSVQVSNISFENYVNSNLSLEDYLVSANSTHSKVAYLSLMLGLGDLLVGASMGVGVAMYTLVDLLSNITVENVGPVVEELFLNMTLSVLASGDSLFTYNDTVMGNVTNYLTTYEYRPFELVVVYVLAFLLTLLCSSIGFYAFFVNGGSYRNVFSTFIRATNKCDLPIEDNDTGIEPRPRSLGRAQVNLMTKFSESVVMKSAEEKHFIKSVPVPPAFTHISSSPRDVNLTSRSPSSNTSSYSRATNSICSIPSTDELPLMDATVQISASSPFPSPVAIRIPRRVLTSDRDRD